MFVFNRVWHNRLQVFLAAAFFVLIAQAGLSAFSPAPKLELGEFDISTLIRNPGY